ncbi:unnamed protein product [Rhizophagus irregularis]|nr:unnamed protein product [Rhizophagus irregularis]
MSNTPRDENFVNLLSQRGGYGLFFINDKKNHPNVKADIIHNENWALSFPFLTSSNQLVIVVGGTIYTNANIQEEAKKQKQEVNNFFSEVKIRREIITIHCDTNWSEVASEIYCLVVLEQILKKRKEVDEYYYSLEITQDRVDYWQKKYEKIIGRKKEDREKFEKEIIVKANEFLESKKTFLNCRQRTIKELQNCYNELAGSSGYAAIEEVGRAVNSVGEIELTFGIPKALGGLVTAVSNYSKIRSITESNKAFQEYLIYDNNNILPSFNEVYASLLKLIQENEDLEICSRVKNALELQNGKELKVELETQKENFGSRFEKELKNIPEIQAQVQLIQQMEILVKTFRDELKSKSKFSNKCKQRNSELRQLFTNLPSTSKEFSNELEKIKRGLSKKELIEQKIEELYQTNDKLRQLNMNTIIFI